jgi:DNA-directed RNA polymerase specialized sigma24 family protein
VSTVSLDARAPSGERFPATRHSILEASRSDDPTERRRAIETLAASYWRPVYKYLRLRWRLSREDAEDLTQDFFALAAEKEFFAKFDPSRARFRTFLRVCVDARAANVRKAATRLKRGGGYQLVSLDVDAAERDIARHAVIEPDDGESYFRREAMRELFTHSIEMLREYCRSTGKGVQFSLFERYDLFAGDPDARPNYASLGAEFDLPVTQVTNYLAFVRRQLRRIVLEQLRALCASDEEMRLEARDILGADPR